MRTPVLILNSRPWSWFQSDGQELLPLDLIDPWIITHAYGGVSGLPSELLPKTFVCDIRNDAEVMAVANWIIETASIERVVAPSEFFIDMAAHLRSMHDLPGLNRVLSRGFRDKITMKRLVHEAGITVPRFYELSVDFDERCVNWSSLHVLKPRAGSGGTDVHVVANSDELRQHMSNLTGNPDDYQLEEFVEGSMLHCDAVVNRGEIVFSSVCEYLAKPGDFGPGRWAGSALLPAGVLWDRVVDLNERIIRALGLPEGVTHLELFNCPDGRLVFCEIAARPGGGGIDHINEVAFGMNLREASIRVESGLAPPCHSPVRLTVDKVAAVGLYPNGAFPIDDSWVHQAQFPVLWREKSVRSLDGHYAPRHCTDYLDLVVTAVDSATDIASRANAAVVAKGGKGNA